VDSHIIPGFVFRWKKDTSATGRLRSSDSPQKRVQDGLKVPMLCGECEGLFNSFETPFASQIFYPFATGKADTVSYGPWLLKFCVSVSWRILALAHIEGRLAGWSEHRQILAHAALKRWKAFLQGAEKHPGEFSQELLPLAAVEKTTVGDLPVNINRYFLRGVDMTIALGERKAVYTYAKMGPFCLFGTIEATPNSWEGTKVHVSHGVLRPSRYVLPMEMLDFIKDRANKMASVSIPENQMHKVVADIRRDMDRFAKSDLQRAMQLDIEMFGTDAVFGEKSEKAPGC
jgi:hypothetical protein